MGGVACTALVLGVVGDQTIENFDCVRLVGPVTALFFLVAAIPTFMFLRERGTPKVLPPGESMLGAGVPADRRDRPRAGRVPRSADVLRIAFFFAMAGLSIVIAFAFIYGDQVIRWSATSQMLMFVITNLTASVGAIGFGFLQKRWGNLRTFNLTLAIWVAAIVGIWGTPGITVWLNGAFGTAWRAESVFLCMGAMAGLCLGATQSASRTLVAVFSPESKSAEFFGFWGLFGKLAAIFGLLSLGVLQVRLGLQSAILLCSLFFLVALVLTLFVREERGRAAAAVLGSDPDLTPATDPTRPRVPGLALRLGAEGVEAPGALTAVERVTGSLDRRQDPEPDQLRAILVADAHRRRRCRLEVEKDLAHGMVGAPPDARGRVLVGSDRRRRTGLCSRERPVPVLSGRRRDRRTAAPGLAPSPRFVRAPARGRTRR